MSNYRKFWLVNGKDEIVQFTNNNSKIFLNNPTGLGVNNTLTTNVYQDQMNVIGDDQSFNTIGGEMLFYDYANKDKYELYNDFITFLTYKPLVLHYEIPTETPQEYTIDVDLISIDKTEVKTDGLLRCNFQLQTLSRWKGTEVVLTTRGTELEIVNNGHMPVGFEMTIKNIGTLIPGTSHLTFTLEQDEVVYGIGKFLVSDQGSPGYANFFSSIYVNSIDGEQNIILTNTSNTILPNPLSYQDMSISNGNIYVTFVKLARGTSTLKIVAGRTDSNSDIEVKFVPLYRSV